MSCAALTIALVHNDYSAELVSLLASLGTVEVFTNQFRLREYLFEDKPCDLVVSATDGALGMNVCIIARQQGMGIPILWLTEQKEFEAQSKRIPVDAFLVKPVELTEVLAVAKQVLESPPNALPPENPVWVNATPKPSHADPPRKKTFGTWLGSHFWSGTERIDIDENEEDTR